MQTHKLEGHNKRDTKIEMDKDRKKRKEIHKIDPQGEARWSVRKKYNSQKFEVSQHYCFLRVATVEPPTWRTQRLKAHQRIESPNYESEIHSHFDPEKHIRGIVSRLQTKVADNNKCLVCGWKKSRREQEVKTQRSHCFKLRFEVVIL